MEPLFIRKFLTDFFSYFFFRQCFKMSWSKNRRHSYQKRQSWAEEVIAAAMMTTSGHVSFDVIPDEDLNEDDEGIVSDESPPSSNNEELYNSEKCLDATSRHHRPKEEIMVCFVFI